MIEFNSAPYYDDYDKDNKFHRILYNPSRAVQARELTQQQTILQNQIERFGDHIFKNGAMVIPGQITFDSGMHYVKILTNYGGLPFDQSQMIGKTIEGQTSGVIAEVTTAIGYENPDPKTLYLKYIDAGPNNYPTFIDGEDLKDQNSELTCTVEGIKNITTPNFESTGIGSASSIEAGIYYLNGFFVIVDNQTIIVEKYDNSPSAKIGLKLYETLITAEEDPSLNDNAIGSYNYAAPGADRYKLSLDLITIGLEEEPPNDFIELQRVENGILINEIRNTEYNELEKTFARRTFDESGDYTVSPFNISIREHLKNPAVARLADGKYLLADGGDEEKIAIGMEPGKAYVKGYERVTLATSWLSSNKARTVDVANNTVTNFNIGQYIYVTNVFKVPDISTLSKVTLWDTASTAGNTTGNNIGYARVKSIQLVDKNTPASTSIYKLFLFDINLDENHSWSEVSWISDSDSSAQFTCATDVSSWNADLSKRIVEQDKNHNLFKLPRSFVKTLKINNISDTTYTVLRTYPQESVVGNTVVLTAGTNEVFNAFTGSNYIVMDLNATTSDNAFIDLLPADVVLSSDATSVSINITTSTSVRILAPVVKTVANERAKTLQTNRTMPNITTPNTVGGGVDLLDRSDGYRLVSVIEDPGVGGANKDITDRYTFDSGQREGFYDLARIQLNYGETAPSTTIAVTFDYFSHAAGDYCSVDSYSIDYYDIPPFYSEEDQYDLSDAVDFRPVMDSTGDSFSGANGIANEFPLPQSNIRTDFEHYLPRIDKLYMDYAGNFGIIEGTPALNPKPPKSPDNGMVLYVLRMNPYTISPKEVDISFVENKRYTMRDIGLLENRISDLEYYNTLSLLEKETAQLQIKDDAGFDRFKNGFIVEPFNTHIIGDSLNPDYKCSIDPNEELMRAEFTSDSVALEWSPVGNGGLSSGVQKTGNLVTLPYVDQQFISQTLASTTENVNPFAVRTFEGKITFQPDSDNWYDTQKNGELVVNNDAHYEALQFMATYAKGLNGVEWNNWQTQWSSTSSKTQTRTTRENRRNTGIDHGWGWLRDTTTSIKTSTTTSGQRRTGTRTTSTTKTINKDLGDRTVGINYIPYMRSIPVLVKVTSMKPRTKLYPYFDDIQISEYCAPAVVVPITGKSGTFNTKDGEEDNVTVSSGGTGVVVFQTDTSLTIVNLQGTWSDNAQITGPTGTANIDGNVTPSSSGDQLVTDEKGRIALVYTIPNNDEVKFRTGERVFELSDQINNTEANQTKAKGIFKSEGSMLQQEGTVLSTKTIRFEREPVRQFRVRREQTTEVSTTKGRWFDPLAQTFLIEEEGGCFITKADIYFQKKDPTLPVNFQIREVENGYPSQRIVPYSEVTLYPEDVNVPADERNITATTFTMPAPVYLQQGGEYCFVLLSDSFDYNVWVAEIGQVDIITDEMISKQPYNGVLFKSQNASTWTADQNQDMMFRLYKARFDIDSIGVNYLFNKDLSEQFLDINPLETFTGNPIVRVHQRAHGFSPGSNVTLDGFTGIANGITLSDINDKTFAVSNIELDSYTIDISTVTNSVTGVNYVGGDIIDTGKTGGSDAYATRNIQMDLMRPNLAEVVLPYCSSAWAVKTVTGQSINGTQTPYIKSGSYYPINPVENNEMIAPMMVANRENEVLNLSNVRSLDFRQFMASNNINVSPVLDLNRISCITVANRIDWPEAGTHYKYTPESDAKGGSAAAKYMTRKIDLEEPAGALKLFLTAMVLDGSSFEIWYRKKGPYETVLLGDRDWTQLTDPDEFVPLSQNDDDFREYEYTIDFTAAGGEFTSIAIKIVSLSTDTTRVPIFDDLRVICLAT